MTKTLRITLAMAAMVLSSQAMVSNAMAGGITFKAETPQSVKALAHQLGDMYCPSTDPFKVSDKSNTDIKKIRSVNDDESIWKLSMSNDGTFGHNCGVVTVKYFASIDSLEYTKDGSTVLVGSESLSNMRGKYGFNKGE